MLVFYGNNVGCFFLQFIMSCKTTFFAEKILWTFFYFEIQGWGGGGGWGCAITALRDEKILPHRQCLLCLCLCLQCVVALCGAQKLFVLKKCLKSPSDVAMRQPSPVIFVSVIFACLSGHLAKKCTLSDFLFVQVNWRVWGWIWNSSWSTAKIKKEAGEWSCWGQRSHIETSFILLYSNY